MGQLLKREDGKCPACPASSPRKAVDKHHILPVEYGGPDDGDLIYLCPSCHDEVHKLALQIFNGKLDPATVPTPVMRELATKIVAQHRAFVTGEAVATDARRRIIAHCSEEELARVHVIRDHYNFNSIEKMILSLVNREYAKITSGK